MFADPAFKGVAIIALGFLIITASDALVKWTLPEIGVGGAMLARGIFGALTIAAVSGALTGRTSLRPNNRRLIAWRSVLHTAVTIAYYLAWFSGMPLADSYAITAVTPLLMTLLAIPLLGERVSTRRWLLAALGFAGVLLMLRPGGDLWRPEAAILLAGIILMAVTRIWTRLLARTDRPATIAFWLLAAHIPVGLAWTVLSPPTAWPHATTWIGILLLGATNGTAHFLFARAFALAPVGLLAPFEYSTLIFGTLLGLAIWGDVPSWLTIAGAAVVAAAGLLNLREGRRAQNTPDGTTPAMRDTPGPQDTDASGPHASSPNARTTRDHTAEPNVPDEAIVHSPTATSSAPASAPTADAARAVTPPARAGTPPATPEPHLRHDARRGALCMLGAAALFTVMSALAKHLSDRIPFNELMTFRCAFALPVTLFVGWRAGMFFRTRRLGGHALRSLAGICGMACGFYSLTLLPLADQIAVNYTQPLFVILLAIPWLGERPSPIRWAAVALGFVGVLVVALGQGAFSGSANTWGYAVAAIAGLFGGLATMLVRQLSATESSTTIVMWQSLLMTLMISVTVPFTWVTPSWTELGIMVLMGLVGGVAQVLLTEAYASAQPSSLGPFNYTGLIWAILLGWLVFGDTPSWPMLAGSALIVAAGFLVLRGETRREPRPQGTT
ncbi:EamA family transporter [Roseomonas sp. CCTCC AB2023176]|uniref:DMT family transporter n=1 Tax=Roseomonas sp. CCTCC AB2023176 TaxID=3342640 RepID=UPI0035DC437A